MNSQQPPLDVCVCVRCSAMGATNAVVGIPDLLYRDVRVRSETCTLPLPRSDCAPGMQACTMQFRSR